MKILQSRITPATIFKFEADKGATGGSATEIEKAPEVERAKNLEDFNQRFLARKVNPQSVGEKPTEEHIEQVRKSSQEFEEKKTEQEKVQPKREGGNIKNILEAKRTAEKERDELKTKQAEFETSKTELEKRVSELQAKIDAGGISGKREQELQGKIDAFEARIAEEKAALVNENARLKTRVSYFDLAENEDFKKQYLSPVVDSFNAAVESLGADEKANRMLNQALIANAASINAESKEERIEAERTRDGILSQILDDMSGFQKGNFTQAMQSYIRNAQMHAKALREHETTASQMKEQLGRKRDEAYSNTVQKWKSAFKDSEADVSQYLKVSKEDTEIAKDMGIDIEAELANSTQIAEKAVIGSAPMAQSVSLLQKGRAFSVVEALLKVTRKQLAEAREVIAKQRKGTTAGGGSGSEQRRPAEDGKTNREGLTREEWQRKFQPQ